MQFSGSISVINAAMQNMRLTATRQELFDIIIHVDSTPELLVAPTMFHRSVTVKASLSNANGDAADASALVLPLYQRILIYVAAALLLCVLPSVCCCVSRARRRRKARELKRLRTELATLKEKTPASTPTPSPEKDKQLKFSDIAEPTTPVYLSPLARELRSPDQEKVVSFCGKCGSKRRDLADTFCAKCGKEYISPYQAQGQTSDASEYQRSTSWEQVTLEVPD